MQPALDFSAPRGKYPIAMQPEHAGGAVRGRGEEQCEPNLKDDWMEKATGGGDHKLDQRYTGATTAPPTLKELGISKIQSSTWQKLGAMPQREFDLAIGESVKPPTTSGELRSFAEPPSRPIVKTEALWLWGRLLDNGEGSRRNECTASRWPRGRPF